METFIIICRAFYPNCWFTINDAGYFVTCMNGMCQVAGISCFGACVFNKHTKCFDDKDINDSNLFATELKKMYKENS